MSNELPPEDRPNPGEDQLFYIPEAINGDDEPEFVEREEDQEAPFTSEESEKIRARAREIMKGLDDSDELPRPGRY